MNIYNVYVVGKNTPNKIKLFQMLGRRKPDDNVSPENLKEKLEFTKEDYKKYVVMNVTEEEVDSLKKDKNAYSNLFYYVYDVDDRETFEKLEKIHQKLKEKFNDEGFDRFVLYGINSNIKNERKVSFEELMTTAARNKIHYFELQEFNMKNFHKNIDFPGNDNLKVYVTASEQLGYKKIVDEEIKEKLKNFIFLDELFVTKKIEEMEPLEEIIEKSIEEGNRLSINFIYSPYDRETFTSIEEYVSKCSNLQNYYHLSMHISENRLIEGKGKEKEVTSLEVTQICSKYKIDKTTDFSFGSTPEKKKKHQTDLYRLIIRMTLILTNTA